MPRPQFTIHVTASCLGKPSRPSNLPPCGGDAWQGRGGCRGRISRERAQHQPTGHKKRPGEPDLPCYLNEPCQYIRGHDPEMIFRALKAQAAWRRSADILPDLLSRTSS
ncbi:hypothetical protein GR210_20070 [Rhizobium leguminosarum]|nr:hypothetical protein [Rhizobium leguminosarum]